MAYTVEFDNQSELALPHHTTATAPRRQTSRPDTTPWLVSYVCWANVLQYVGPDGLTVAALREQARTTHLLLEGLRRWRYVRLIPAEGRPLTKPIAAATLVRTTRHGRLALECGAPCPPSWTSAGGPGSATTPSSGSTHALATVFVRLPIDPPAFLPVVYPTQNGRAEIAPPGPPSHVRPRRQPPTSSTLLAGVLLGLHARLRNRAEIALPIGANTLRVLGRRPEPCACATCPG